MAAAVERRAPHQDSVHVPFSLRIAGAAFESFDDRGGTVVTTVANVATGLCGGVRRYGRG